MMKKNDGFKWLLFYRIDNKYNGKIIRLPLQKDDEIKTANTLRREG